LKGSIDVFGRRVFRRIAFGRFLRKRKTHRGQILILAIVLFLLFFLVAVVLIDLYHVQEARVWGYRVAQQAALAGASETSSSWIVYQPTLDPTVDTPTPRPDGCIDPVQVELNATDAEQAAENMLIREMEAGRGFDPADYTYDIRVLPDHDGGIIYNWPPPGSRLGGGSDWGSTYPAVGVYLRFTVHTFMSGIVGRTSVTIQVFAAAGIAQPPVCPP
jgi:hypothetical protein